MLKFNEEFIKNYDEDSDKGYILKVDVSSCGFESRCSHLDVKYHKKFTWFA